MGRRVERTDQSGGGGARLLAIVGVGAMEEALPVGNPIKTRKSRNDNFGGRLGRRERL